MNAAMLLASNGPVEPRGPGGRRPAASRQAENVGGDAFAGLLQAVLAGTVMAGPAVAVLQAQEATPSGGNASAPGGIQWASGQGALQLDAAKATAAPASGEAAVPEKPAAPRTATAGFSAQSPAPAAGIEVKEGKPVVVKAGAEAGVPVDGAPRELPGSVPTAQEVGVPNPGQAFAEANPGVPGKPAPVSRAGEATVSEKGVAPERDVRPAGKKPADEPKDPDVQGTGGERFQGLLLRETHSPAPASPTAAEPQVQTPQSGRAEDILRQVAEHIRPEHLRPEHFKLAVQGGKGEVKIQLHPAELGRIDLRLTVEGGSLSARFLVQSGEVRQVLEANLGQLRQSLADQGVNVDLLNVSVAGGGFAFDGGGHRFSEGRSDEGGNPRAGRPARSPVYATEAVLPGARSPYGSAVRGSSSLFDYLV